MFYLLFLEFFKELSRVIKELRTTSFNSLAFNEFITKYEYQPMPNVANPFVSFIHSGVLLSLLAGRLFVTRTV